MSSSSAFCVRAHTKWISVEAKKCICGWYRTSFCRRGATGYDYTSRCDRRKAISRRRYSLRGARDVEKNEILNYATNCYSSSTSVVAPVVGVKSAKDQFAVETSSKDTRACAAQTKNCQVGIKCNCSEIENWVGINAKYAKKIFFTGISFSCSELSCRW